MSVYVVLKVTQLLLSLRLMHVEDVYLERSSSLALQISLRLEVPRLHLSSMIQGELPNSGWAHLRSHVETSHRYAAQRLLHVLLLPGIRRTVSVMLMLSPHSHVTSEN